MHIPTNYRLSQSFQKRLQLFLALKKLQPNVWFRGRFSRRGFLWYLLHPICKPSLYLHMIFMDGHSWPNFRDKILAFSFQNYGLQDTFKVNLFWGKNFLHLLGMTSVLIIYTFMGFCPIVQNKPFSLELGQKLLSLNCEIDSLTDLIQSFYFACLQHFYFYFINKFFT